MSIGKPVNPFGTDRLKEATIVGAGASNPPRLEEIMTSLPSLAQLEAARELVHSVFPGTPQYHWPLLSARTGCETWVKHENHTPVGAFKLRGGLVYMKDRADRGETGGVIAATRGNHGQSIATAGALFGIPVTIVVPKGNSREKNAAMQAQGAELIEIGDDFQEAYEKAQSLAEERGLFMLPSMDMKLVEGVASYALEFFTAQPALDTVYVPIGMGSGICAVIAARDALGLTTKVVGVVSEGAPSYALSFEAGEVIPTDRADTFADGVACRSPLQAVVDIIRTGAARVVTVSDREIESAIRAYYTDTHNIAEGAGAVPLAALLKEKDRMKGRKVGVILTGGNIDRDVYQGILSQEDP